MGLKQFLPFPKMLYIYAGYMQFALKKYFLFHLVLVLAICTALYFLFFFMLNRFTAHGREIKMPGITGMDLGAAMKLLESQHFKVSVDSTYEPAMKPMSILKQLPDSGAMVKEGRIAMLTVNMVTPPQIPMPNLVGISYNSAEMLLRNNKLVLNDTVWKNDVHYGAVLEQNYNGHPIKAGDVLPQGSKISLVIGDGGGNTEHDVISVTGMSVDGAKTTLGQYDLRVEIVVKDPTKKITDTLEATVVDQIPKEKNDAGMQNRIKSGDKFILIIE
jgi:beta-lactam-binding protein with PASTA domain